MGTIITESWGSQQWRMLRRNLRDGMPIEEAAPLSGMNLIEARALEKLDAKRAPLPDEAFALLYDPDAPRAASSTQAKEAGMAKDDENGAAEYKRPDAELAFKIYDQSIKPKEAHLATIKGDMSEPYQQIKDNAHYPRKVLNFIVGLENEEDAKRDHMLLALSEGLRHRKLFLPRDLVTMANGEDGDELVPTGEREDEGLLVDEPEGDEEGEEDLPIAAEQGERPDDAHPGEQIGGFTEASDAEISKQQGRGRGRKAKSEPAAGTGAAAMKAMSKTAQQNASMLQ